jgi:tRNAThr (cytosine32-N3)-methyltransferase
MSRPSQPPSQAAIAPEGAEDRALRAIDAAHAADPERTGGDPAELLYVEHVARWIGRLIAQPSQALRLAARCQHLERWAIPRADFPLDREGYLTWRKTVHRRQGERAREILLAAGIDAATATRVEKLVAKHTAKRDAEGQALEDAACLVFLECELVPFAASHPDYARDKLVQILRRTWVKMSPRGHELAATIDLPPPVMELVREAAAIRDAD